MAIKSCLVGLPLCQEASWLQSSGGACEGAEGEISRSAQPWCDHLCRNVPGASVLDTASLGSRLVQKDEMEDEGRGSGRRSGDSSYRKGMSGESPSMRLLNKVCEKVWLQHSASVTGPMLLTL